MAFVHSLSSRILINEDHHSASVTGYTLAHSRAFGTTTALTDTGYRGIPGLANGKVTLKGLFDSAAGGLYEEILSTVGTDDALLVTVMPEGHTLGATAFLAVCDTEGFAVDASITDAVGMSIEGQPGDGVDWGVVLHAHGAETADVNSTGVDNGAATANGGVATIHVTAYSGLTNAVMKIQDSANNSTWADIVTFTTVTGVTSERKTVSGAVRQYVRAFLDVTGSGSVTYAIAFARR